MTQVVILCLLACLPLLSFAQRIVTGQVTNADTKKPIEGASVMVKGNTKGTTTDVDGAFKISVPDGGVLIISSVGFSVLEVKPSGAVVAASLTPVNASLAEVMVVGFGKQKKVSVTAAISTVSSKELLQTPVANVTNTLVGRMPGLIAQQTSGDPGVDASSFFIRGKATTNNAAPLVLIDGVERPFNSVSAFEIENVSILKDASATAVYGVRGANGVILVTTKRGLIGKPSVSLTFNSSIQENTRMAKFLNSYDFATLMNEARANENAAPIYDEAALAAYKNHTDPYLFPDVDYTKEFLKPFAAQQTINANVSGGTKTAKYFVSGSYLTQNGLFKHTKDRDFDGDLNYTRYNFRSNIDLDVNSDLRLSVNLAARAETRNGPRGGTSRLFSLLMRTPPNNGPLVNPDGTFGAGPSLTDNVLAEFSYQGFTKDYTSLMEGTFIANYKMDKLIKGLSFKPMVAFTNHYRQQTSRFRGTSSQDFYTRYKLTGKDANGNYTYGAPIGSEAPLLSYAEGFVSDASNSYRTVYLEAGLNYANKFGNNNVSGLLLFNRSRQTRNSSTNDWPFSYQGVVGRLTYNWDETYMAEINMGYNGSEQFPPGNRYGFFPSFSLGWVATNERFLRDVKFLDFLKLRASFGQVGNDQSNQLRFLYQEFAYTTSGGYSYGLTNNNSPGGILEGQFGNPYVQWEKANKYNAGIETQFLNKRLSLNVDVFYEKRNNILTTPGTIPATVGAALPVMNIGIVENKGYEIDLGYTDHVGAFNYFVKANLSFARNKRVFIDEPGNPHPWMYRTGERLDMVWGLQTMGFFNSQEEIDKWATSSYDPGALGKLQPGDFKYKDQNGDGVIDIKDQVALRNPTVPEYIFGFSFGGSYKGFDFSALFQGADNTAMLVNLEAAYEFFNTGKVMDIHLNRWTPDNKENATYPRLSSSPSGSQHNYITSDYWLKDASYIRLKQAEIGYTLPKSLMEKWRMKGIRVYLNGSNLYTWDKIKYLDPENRNQRAWYYPQQRVWSAGANITL
jgi:TonB-linked SusC/RagA family outer membrane protein